MGNSKDVKERFDTLYAEWEKLIQDPRIQISSNPLDYIDNEPYRGIVKLGKDVLPLILEKIEEGVFFMNQAVLEVAGIDLNEIIEEESKKPADARVPFMAKEKPAFLSEQQKSELILKHIGGK
jgi:hypothetical protein